RTPAAYGGVVGFRPSGGTVPRTDLIAGLVPWSVLGPIRSRRNAKVITTPQRGRAYGAPGLRLNRRPNRREQCRKNTHDAGHDRPSPGCLAPPRPTTRCLCG